MSGFLTDDFNSTGRAGVILDIGKGREPGVSRAIDLVRNDRCRNSDIKGESNINEGLRSSGSSNGYKSNEDNLRSGNLEINNKDVLRFNNHSGNNVNSRFNRKRGGGP